MKKIWLLEFSPGRRNRGGCQIEFITEACLNLMRMSVASRTEEQGDSHNWSGAVQNSRQRRSSCRTLQRRAARCYRRTGSKSFMQHSTGLGLQILVLRRIEPKEITRTYVPTQIIGWRYHPDAHGKPPFCGCDYCQRGLIKNRKIREKYKTENPSA